MRFSDIDRNPDSKKLRFFALAWLLFFGAMGVFRLWKDADSVLGWALLSVGLIVGLLGIVQPYAVRAIFVGAMIATFPIGWVISHLLLGIVFYGLILPIGLLFRVIGRDTLRLRKPKLDSYWWRMRMLQIQPDTFANFEVFDV